MKNPHNLTIGQELYFVHADKRNKYTRVDKILKFGKVWATVENGARFDPETLYVDGKGYSSPGRYYLSKEAYEEKVERERIWQKIKSDMGYGTPDCTLEEMKQVATILKVTI